MKTVVASCTKRKRDEPAPARKLYDPSTYFRKQARYAETADEWWIQSARYGLVHPDQVIKPYDKRADDLEEPERWAWEIACRLLRKYDPAKTTIDILGGSAYADPLTPHLEEFGFEVHEPLRGQRIGDRMASLDRLADFREAIA